MEIRRSVSTVAFRCFSFYILIVSNSVRYIDSGDYDDHFLESEDDEGEEIVGKLLQLLKAQSMGNKDKILQKL